MILKKRLVWGRVSGKLSLTPEQAKRMLGFDMDPKAIGVVIAQYRKKGIAVVRNLFPYRGTTSKKLLSRRKVFGKIRKIASAHMEDIIRPVWDRYTRGKNYKGFNLFVKVNIERVGNPPDWSRLLLTRGRLPSPKILSVSRFKNTYTISLAKNSTSALLTGVGILNLSNRRERWKLYHFLPAEYGSKIRISLSFTSLKSPMIFVYYKKGTEYSNSVSFRGQRSENG